MNFNRKNLKAIALSATLAFACFAPAQACGDNAPKTKVSIPERWRLFASIANISAPNIRELLIEFTIFARNYTQDRNDFPIQ